MLASISSRQFAEWRDFADLEPFDEERSDLRAASIVQAIYNTARRKGQAPIKLEDCALRFRSDTKSAVAIDPASAKAQVANTMRILMAIHNRPSRAEKVEPKKRGR